MIEGGDTHNGTSPRTDRAFDPKPLIERLRAGGLDPTQEVDLLLLWMRKEHPQARITTDLAQFDESIAVIKAFIALPSGAEATGYGSALAADGREMVERAETKAIGRALNALGYSAERFDPASASAGQRQQTAPTPVRAVEAPAEEEPEPAPVAESTLAPQEGSVSSEEDDEEADPADYSWTAFWRWARPLGFENRAAIEAYIGRDFNNLNPAALRKLIQAKERE